LKIAKQQAMKKILLLVALFAGVNLSAQELYKQFNAPEYAQNLGTRIIETFGITQPQAKETVRNATYSYAKSIQKYILWAEKNGSAEGKSLDEVVEMVKPRAIKASGLMIHLRQVLNNEQLEQVKALL